MGRTLIASGVMTPIWRAADDTGEAIDTSEEGSFKLVEPDPSDYVTPPDGARALMRLSGISEIFEMDSQFSDTPTKNVRVEFLILKVSGGGNHGQASLGKRFTGLYTPSVGPKSNLGKLFGRLRERDIERGEEIDMDAFITTEFVAPIVVNAKGYASIIPETIERGKTKLSPFLNGAALAAPAATKTKTAAAAAPPEPEEPGEDFLDEADL